MKLDFQNINWEFQSLGHKSNFIVALLEFLFIEKWQFVELNHNCGTYFEDPLNSYLPRPQDPKCKRTFLGGKTDIINKLIWRSESDCYIADCERFSSL